MDEYRPEVSFPSALRAASLAWRRRGRQTAAECGTHYGREDTAMDAIVTGVAVGVIMAAVNTAIGTIIGARKKGKKETEQLTDTTRRVEALEQRAEETRSWPG